VPGFGVEVNRALYLRVVDGEEEPIEAAIRALNGAFLAFLEDAAAPVRRGRMSVRSPRPLAGVRVVGGTSSRRSRTRGRQGPFLTCDRPDGLFHAREGQADPP
jgi:hypothetical protein